MSFLWVHGGYPNQNSHPSDGAGTSLDIKPTVGGISTVFFEKKVIWGTSLETV